jgi:hypothetical protein
MNNHCPGCGRLTLNPYGQPCNDCGGGQIPKAPPLEVQVISRQPEVGLAPNFPRTAQVSAYHSHGVGVIHAFSGQDADILDQIEATSMVLQDLGKRMRSFTALDEETRKLIKNTVSLAVDLQNEVDRRKGR